MGEKALATFQIHQDGFSFLGIENVVTESSDFGAFWVHFFQAGGYEKIIPYAVDTKPVNIWYTNPDGQEIYFQGLMAGNAGNVPEGYTLKEFPAGDYLVVTTEWMETNDEAVGDNGNGRCNRYAETAPIPEGYIRNDGPGSPVTKIEKENADTPDGSRYEVWVPIKKSGL